MQRRQFLKSSVVLGASPLAGCCVNNLSIEPDLVAAMETDLTSGTIMPYLAPTHIEMSNRVTTHVYDPHMHIYNASDWQIGGGLRGPLANSKPEPLRTMLRLVAGSVEELSERIALSARTEMEKLNEWALLPINDARAAAIDYAQTQDEWLAEELFNSIDGTLFGEFLENLLDIKPDVIPGSVHTDLSPEFLLEAFRYSLGDNNMDVPASGSLVPDYSSAQGLIGFLYHILSPRYRNLLAYQDAYTSDPNSLGVDRCYAAVLDFDYWIGNCDHPPSRLEDQIVLMKRISQLSGGYMQPIVAYNPWTDINDNDDSIQLVIKAIDQYGFAGVKIYPQLGFYPSDNATQAYPPDGDHPDLNLLDAKLAHFFAICNSRGVPVMAHSGDSMGRELSHNKLSGPAAWNRFFSHSENQNSKINLAHIGGDENGPTGNNWTEMFVQTMNNPNAHFLNGDVGMWKEMAEGNGAAIARLVDRLDDTVSNGQTVSDRVMFGTDWLMLSIHGTWRLYPREIQSRLLAAGVPVSSLEKIMWQNAEALFPTVST